MTKPSLDEILFDAPPVLEEAVEYSPIRSGVVDFIESAVGAGDELDALVRRMSGESATWDEAITASREELEEFEEDNPIASKVLTTGGVISGLFIPAAGAAKIAQAGTKGTRALTAAKYAAAEGAAYGFLSGEGEGRVDSAALGALLGTGLGAAGGAFLTKGVPTPKNKTKWTHIGGDAFEDASLQPEPVRVGKKVDTTLQRRTTKDVDPKYKEHIKDNVSGGGFLLSTKQFIAKNVGIRAAKLSEDAETAIRRGEREVEEHFDTDFAGISEELAKDVDLKSAILRMNESFATDKRVSWAALRQQANAKQKPMIDLLEEQTKKIQESDWVKFKSDVDYFPATKLPGRESVLSSPNEYLDPVTSLKNYALEVDAANKLANRFNIDTSKLRQPKIDKGESRIHVVISAIESAAKKQGASPDVSANLGNGLRSLMISSKQGGHALGAVARRLASAALLGNPNNAVLNMGEWATGPIYQNGLRDWAATAPGAIISAFNKHAGMRSKDWVDLRTMGLDNDYMGEVAQVAKTQLDEAAQAAHWTQLSDRVVDKVDALGRFLYKYSGVSTSNRMGQEIQMNSAYRLGKRLSQKGRAKDLEKLRNHDGMRGLSESEFQSTVEALKKGDITDPWVINYVGSSLNKWQPVSPSVLPKIYHDNPNGRIMFSMLSYMNTQMNGLRTDVGLNLTKAVKEGFNTKEGAYAFKEALKNAAKYTALFGVFAGMWDDFRQTLDQTKDKDLEDILTPEGISKAFLNQIASNVSSGLVNIRAEEFGGKPIEPIPAPLSAGFRVGSGIYDTGKNLLTGERDPLNPLLNATQTYVPVFSNIDRPYRAITGDRLLTGD